MDNVDAKEARVWISMIKTAVPNISIRIVDEAIQMFGALGVSQDTPLATYVYVPAHAALSRWALMPCTAWWWAVMSSSVTHSAQCSPASR